MPHGLLEYCVDPQHLAAHRITTSSSHAKFKVRLLLGPPLYSVEGWYRGTYSVEGWYRGTYSVEGWYRRT